MQLNNSYCVYLTVYRGKKLPPFYIGYTQTSKIIVCNYNGSVQSKKYKNIWKYERRHNPHLFKTYIIKTFDSKDAAIQCESLYIRKLNAIHNQLYINTGYFYNNRVYVSSMKGKKHSDETRDKISRSRKDFYKTKRGQQLKCKLQQYTKSPVGVKHRQDLALQRAKPTHRYDLNGTYIDSFNSIKAASESTNIPASNIGACCRGKVKSAGGFYWSFIKAANIKVPVNNWIRGVIQYTNSGEYVNTFNSIKTASESTGISMSSISSCCSGRLMSAGGYTWVYQKSDID